MSGTTPRDEDAGDSGYTSRYDDDDDAQETPSLTARRGNDDDGDDDDDDTELAEMFAKVQTIQQTEGIKVKPIEVKQPVGRAQPYEQLEVSIPDSTAARKRSSSTTPPSGKSSGSSSARTVSPAGSRVGTTRSPDGITTISRRTLATGQVGVQMDVLAGVKKPSLFQDRLLQTAKQQPQALEQLKQKVAAAAPATIAKRVETLSEPKKSDTGRKFALDDDEKHCRFRVKKKANGGSGGRDAYEDDEGGRDRTSDFLARMEATERNKQKKLELTRGEKDYMANLNKKVCPKCDVPQSYSEYRDKKKRCQTCGSEFRVPQAWGDVGKEFICRISEDSRTREERRQQIRAQVVQQEVGSGRVAKSATQQLYEKTLQQRNEHKTFLDRNYTATKATTIGGSSSNAKTKQAQLQLQMQLQAQRAKLLAAAQPPIY